MEDQTHLLSLKVMRVSRPELANAWQPFYSSSPSFSAHSTASILSLQGASPLPGHPKTLRDLTHALELLTLPSSFGSIQLGETFSSCLCVNNEAEVDIEGVSLKVEMQTATAKVLLAEMGGPNNILTAKDAFESIVHHEIKELGQHVLACTVTYRPSGTHQLTSSREDSNLQTLRKFYKFAVTNPLSVKTKVHLPRSPSALMSPQERDKVFLEVHMQNLTQEAMYFERVHLECAEGWDAEDINAASEACGGTEELFVGSQALMQPQDIRQYIYILRPKSVSLIPATYAPGSAIPLGRLDILWRSFFGEPGRLLTSILSRKIPIPPPIQTAPSAIPQYLKRSAGILPPSRPQSPQLNQSRAGSRAGSPPPQQPSSPPQNQPVPIGPSLPPTPFHASAAPLPDIEVNLVARDIPRHAIRVETPFTMSLTIILSASSIAGGRNTHRVVRLVVQHLQPPRTRLAHDTGAISAENFSSRLPSSGFSTPSPPAHSFNYALAHQKLVAAASPALEHLERNSRKADSNLSSLPLPYFSSHDGIRPNANVLPIGPSSILLAPIEMRLADSSEQPDARIVAVQDFELSYLATQKGYATVGGLRVLLVEDRITHANGVQDTSGNSNANHVRVLKEWDVISEVWVLS